MCESFHGTLVMSVPYQKVSADLVGVLAEWLGINEALETHQLKVICKDTKNEQSETFFQGNRVENNYTSIT